MKDNGIFSRLIMKVRLFKELGVIVVCVVFLNSCASVSSERIPAAAKYPGTQYSCSEFYSNKPLVQIWADGDMAYAVSPYEVTNYKAFGKALANKDGKKLRSYSRVKTEGQDDPTLILDVRMNDPNFSPASYEHVLIKFVTNDTTVEADCIKGNEFNSYK